MATFLVLRQLPGLTRDQYAAAQRAAREAARQTTIGGHVVRHLGGSSSPPRGQAICIFCAESLADVTTVNGQAGVPFTEVLESHRTAIQGRSVVGPQVWTQFALNMVMHGGLVGTPPKRLSISSARKQGRGCWVIGR
jgi:hypothetical protein